MIAACKDSYVVCACGFDRNGKWEWLRIKITLKNDVAKKKHCKKERVLATLLADIITSTNNPLINFCFNNIQM